MELDGKTLAIILWGECDGEEEASTHTGTLRKTAVGYEFYRGENRPTFNLQPEWIDRIRLIPDDLKDTLINADLCLSLTVELIPDGMDVSDLELTGFQIPAGD